MNQVIHVGENGKGLAAKLAMNLMIALIYEGFAEALTLATKLGVDIERLMPLVQASMVRSGVVDYKAPFVMKRDFSPNFPLRLMLKDIHLTLDAAKEARVRLPGLEAVEEVYDLAAEEGHRELQEGHRARSHERLRHLQRPRALQAAAGVAERGADDRAAE